MLFLRQLRRSLFLTVQKSLEHLGDPLYLDVATTLREAGLNDIVLTAGRYGLGSKDTPPSSVFAIYKELRERCSKEPFHNWYRG